MKVMFLILSCVEGGGGCFFCVFLIFLKKKNTTHIMTKITTNDFGFLLS